MICRWVRFVIPLHAPNKFALRHLVFLITGAGAVVVWAQNMYCASFNVIDFTDFFRTVFASTFAAIVRGQTTAIWYRIPCPVYNIVKFFCQHLVNYTRKLLAFRSPRSTEPNHLTFFPSSVVVFTAPPAAIEVQCAAASSADKYNKHFISLFFVQRYFVKYG